MKKNYIYILLVLICSIPALLPLFHNGFFVTDDGEWMIIRFSAFHEAFRDGQFPVRFLGRLNHEYGYPVANFLYPGFMYLGEFIRLLKFGFVDTIKIIFGLSLITSAIFAYLWLSKIFNKWPAFFASLFFLYNPYHLFDIYRRGSIGEILAIGIIPITLWSIESRFFPIYSLSIALLILSHNTLALLFLPLVFIYIYLSQRRTKKYSPLNLFTFTVLGIGLAAFFWLPAIYDLQFTIFSNLKISDPQNYFSQINLIGIANIIALVVAGSLLLIQKKPQSKSILQITIFFLLATTLAIFFALPSSSFFWKFLPVYFIQFPFRVLSISVIGFSFLTAFLLNAFKAKIQILLGILFTVLLVINSSPFILKNEYFDKGERYYSTNQASTTVKNEYMPKWVNVLPTERPKEKVKITDATLSNLIIKQNKITFTSLAGVKANTTIHTIYFPGWQVTIDGNRADIRYNNPRGLIEFFIPPGEHEIKVFFSETPMRILSDILSGISIVALIFISIRKKYV